MEKKTYSKPQLIVHGDVEGITQAAGLENADVPLGPPNTAECDITNDLCNNVS
jgi:hypothetical protein